MDEHKSFPGDLDLSFKSSSCLMHRRSNPLQLCLLVRLPLVGLQDLPGHSHLQTLTTCQMELVLLKISDVSP